MKIQAVTGVALMTLLFLSAVMENKLLDVTADEFFFDKLAITSDGHKAEYMRTAFK